MIRTKNNDSWKQTSPLNVSILLALSVTAGTLLRLHLLTSRSLYVDEGASVLFAKLPWKDLWRTLWNYEANMSLYYLLLHGWMHLFGDSEAAVRGLSVLFGVAAIPATYILGKRLFSRKAAIASAALSAVNAFQIRYSQEARAYSLVMVLVILSTYFFLRAIESPTQKSYWIGYVLISALAIYAQVFALLVVLAQWLSLGYQRLLLIDRRSIYGTLAGFALLTTPMGAFILLKNQGQLNWVPRPTLQQVHDFANFFLGEGGFVLLAVYTALCLAAVFWPPVGEGRECCGFDEGWRTRLVLWWLAFPIASALLVSFVKPIFYDRYMIICAPALVLLAGQGIAKFDQISVRPGGIFSIALTVVIGLSVWGFHRYSSSSASEGDDWRLVSNYILAHQQPGDAAFFYRASGSRPFLYYVHEIEKQSRVSSPEIIFPVDVSDSLDFNVEPNKKQVKHLLEGHHRIWLILQHYQGLQTRELAADDIQAALHERFGMFEERVFPGLSGTIRVLLYIRTPILDSNYKP